MTSKRAILSILVLAWVLWVGPACSASPLMVDKNLFAQDRKPPSPEDATPHSQPGKAGMDIKNIQLDGVIITGNVKKALVRLKGHLRVNDAHGKNKSPSPFVTVRENQQVSDFRVAKIDVKSISLERDGQVYTIDLFSEGKVVPPVTAVQPERSAPPPPPGNVPGMQPSQGPPQSFPNPGEQATTDPALLQQQIMMQQRLQRQMQQEYLQSQGMAVPPNQGNEAANGQEGGEAGELQPQ
jgi:hypothetical protein